MAKAAHGGLPPFGKRRKYNALKGMGSLGTLSVNEATTFRWTFEEDVSHYLEEGIPAIGVWRQKLSDYGEEKAAELIEETGLRVSHLFWAGGFTGSDGRSFRASIEDAEEAIRTAGSLRAESLIVYSGARAGHTHNHARRLFKEALNELAPLAAETGVALAVEPMHPGCAAEFTFLTALDDVMNLLDAVNHDHVKFVLDTYHLGWDSQLISRIPQIVPRLALVQLGDGKAPPQREQDRCRLGEGALPLREIVDALSAAGYNGFYDVELLGEELEHADYRELLRHAKKAFAELVEKRA
jgi:sugar phosphate isomerase/epimerase